MERVVKRFVDHEAADAADRAYYRSLTPQERVDMVLELTRQYREGLDEAADRFERVCRVTRLTER